MCTLSWENKKLEDMGTLINGFFLEANLLGGYTLKLLTSWSILLTSVSTSQALLLNVCEDGVSLS